MGGGGYFEPGGQEGLSEEVTFKLRNHHVKPGGRPLQEEKPYSGRSTEGCRKRREAGEARYSE